ncbi:MAG: aminotransferase class V-fold PLP-dependent enzyme [Bacteroidota bacterium]
MPGANSTRRHFFRKASLLAGLGFVSPLLAEGKFESLFRLEEEDFWREIRQAYSASANLINLNNGGVSPHPKSVQALVDRYTQFANEAPAYYMWRSMGRLREGVRRQLADLAGCSMEEIAIQRNATEALEVVIKGLDFPPGSEILTTDQDYPSILNTLDMRSRRYGIKVNKIALPVPCEDFKEILERFRAAITPQTKLIVLCHIINLSGQILPIKEICDMAHERGIEVLVDGAHSFANLDFKIEELGCDYFGTSLHKWLSAPFGTGMLYVKKEHISKLWPMYGYPEGEKDKMSKFEHLGTRSFPIELGIGEAIRFHLGIGTQRKHKRLLYLKKYWTEQLEDLEEFHLNTSLDPTYACGIVNFRLKNWDSGELGRMLTNKYQLYNTVSRHKDVEGVRISPHVYTSLEDLDHLVRTLKKLAKTGPPK